MYALQSRRPGDRHFIEMSSELEELLTKFSSLSANAPASGSVARQWRQSLVKIPRARSKAILNTDAVKDAENQEAVNILVSMRVAKELTQKELADMLGCSQGRISKLEQGRDEDLRIKDFLDYTCDTEEAVWITIGTPTIGETVKLHIRAIRRLLEELVNSTFSNSACRLHAW